MDRIRRSWRLVKATLDILAADKELLVFPVITLVVMAIVTVVMLYPAYALGVVRGFVRDSDGMRPVGLVLLYLYFVLSAFISFLANTAMVGMAMRRFEGQDPTLADGFRVAFQRLPVIVAYSIIFASVGLLFSLLRQRGDAAGRMIAGIGGMAWGLATYLVVPVLVVEDCGPVQAISRSAGLLKKTWGEQVAGGAGVGLVFGLATLGLVGASLTGLYLAAKLGSVAMMGAAVLVLVIGILAIMVFSHAVQTIYSAAVYRYAVSGEGSAALDRELLASAFVSR